MMSREDFFDLEVGDEFIVSEDAEEQSEERNEEGFIPNWSPRMDRLIGETLRVATKNDKEMFIRANDGNGYTWIFHRLMIESVKHKAKIDISLVSVFA